MSVQPLIDTTRHLHPGQTVFVVRDGWVFPYMPAIVCETRSARQAARYASNMTDSTWWPTPDDWRVGDILKAELGRHRAYRVTRQRMLAEEIWRARSGGRTDRDLFRLWWESGVNRAADASVIGANAAMAARMTFRWELFSHRYLS